MLTGVCPFCIIKYNNYAIKMRPMGQKKQAGVRSTHPPDKFVN